MDLSLLVSAGALISAGLTADAAPGVYVGAGVRPMDFLSLGLELRAVLPSAALARDAFDSSKPVLSSARFDFSNVSALLVPCFHLSYFFGCVVGEMGASLSRGKLASADKFSYGAGPRLGVQIPFADRFAAFGYGEALFAADPQVTHFDQLNAAWRQPVVSAFFGVGLSVRVN